MPEAPAIAVDPDPARARDAFVPFDGTLYLDCAARGPRLRAALAAGQAALAEDATPWRDPAASIEERTERLRATAAATVFDGDADALALAPSAAHGLATAARNLALDAGDAVLVLDGQFPSNLLPWQQRCADAGARLVGVSRGDGEDWTGAVLAALEREPRTRAVALPHARWNDGALLDLDRIADRVHAAGAALVLDLSQSLGVLAADLARWRPDFAVSVGYKWLFGPIGLAWLWAAPHRRAVGVAIDQHWSARDLAQGWHFAVDRVRPHRAGARRFDAGGLDDPVRLAMAQAGLDQIGAWGVAAICAALGERTRALDAALDAHGLSSWKTPGHAPHITALRPPADRLDAVFDALRRERIACTRRLGVLRIAPHLHVGVDDMRRVAEVAAGAR
ncbi:MAG TPA: aminotransferase class V-fold PLP-dependent enzyme [Luteimonas sp.]|nr:aminotransferase class V-fold PLP-dependent enzyme [Luteimonas sp.]